MNLQVFGTAAWTISISGMEGQMWLHWNKVDIVSPNDSSSRAGLCLYSYSSCDDVTQTAVMSTAHAGDNN